MEKRASARFRVIVFILTAATLVCIFSRSVMTAEDSAEESLGVLDTLNRLFSSLGIRAALTDHIVRKLAHFTEFTVLGMLLMSCAYAFDRPRPYRYWATVLLAGLGAAVTDETIQLFSDGRSGQITDVLLDFSGVVAGAAAMLAFYLLYSRIRKRKTDHA